MKNGLRSKGIDVHLFSFKLFAVTHIPPLPVLYCLPPNMQSTLSQTEGLVCIGQGMLSHPTLFPCIKVRVIDLPF